MVIFRGKRASGIKSKTEEWINNIFERHLKLENNERYAKRECSSVATFCNSLIKMKFKGINSYDVRYTQEDANNKYNILCQGLETFFANATVLDEEIAVCFNNTGDILRPSNQTVSKILDKGIAVLVYAGDV